MGRPDSILGQFGKTARCRDAQHGDGVCCALAPSRHSLFNCGKRSNPACTQSTTSQHHGRIQPVSSKETGDENHAYCHKSRGEAEFYLYQAYSIFPSSHSLKNFIARLPPIPQLEIRASNVTLPNTYTMQTEQAYIVDQFGSNETIYHCSCP